MEQSKQKIYFKGLNGVRFFAACAVIFHHIEHHKYWLGLENAWGSTLVDALGHKAVSLFFVLSGFLITYLLMAELEKTKDIAFFKFYLRRALRIWPLYFLVTIIAFFLLPQIVNLDSFGIHLQENFMQKLVLYLAILPNVARQAFDPVLGANQAWSIGVEEQFYLAWPVLIWLFRKNLFQFLIGFLAFKTSIDLALYLSKSYFVAGHSLHVPINFAYRMMHTFQIEQMTLGGIGAWVLYQQKAKFLALIYHPISKYGSMFGLVLMMFLPMHFFGASIIEGIVFTLFLMNLSTHPNASNSMEGPFFNFLGNLSYGVYMYHNICIILIIKMLMYFEVQLVNPTLFNVLLYGGSVIFTTFITAISYEYFESKVLKFKSRFMVIKSGVHPEAKADAKSAVGDVGSKISPIQNQ
ncbi:acyltransferase [Persicobacter psychrovividus]|uniref:Acyltransferase 3 domain-containing protein n=1 Tax=Persicobacter psychrovividus TaxID=387638 RepID=A0ABN6L9E5_9BACT|nr:hypothetical protein PEPS_05080 [Persicobacter psychrovividus]